MSDGHFNVKCAPSGLDGAFVFLYPLKVVDKMAVHRTIPLGPPRQLPYFGVQCVHVICDIRRVRVLKPNGHGELQTKQKDKVRQSQTWHKKRKNLHLHTCAPRLACSKGILFEN